MGKTPNVKQEPSSPEMIPDFDPLPVMTDYNMTEQMAYFCEWYLLLMNPAKAARKAGYTYYQVEGSRLLSNAKVRAYLDKRFGERRIRPTEILDRLRDIAYGDISDYLMVDPEQAQLADGVVLIGSDGAVLPGIWLDLRRAIKDGNTARIKSFKRYRGEWAIELHDPVRAMELLGKHYRMWADVQIQSPKSDGTAAGSTDEELERIAQGKPTDDMLQ